MENLPQEHLDWIINKTKNENVVVRAISMMYLEQFYHHLTSKADQKEQGGLSEKYLSDCQTDANILIDHPDEIIIRLRSHIKTLCQQVKKLQK